MKQLNTMLILVALSASPMIHAEEKSDAQSSSVGATIKNTAKKVGKDVAESAKHTAKEVAKAGKQVGKKTADTAKSIGKKVKSDIDNKNFKPKANSDVPKVSGDRAGTEKPESKSPPPPTINDKPDPGRS